MAFEYKGFKIERDDPMNVCLYRWAKIESAKHGKKTGEVREDWKHLGYYNTFLGAVRRMYDYLLEEGHDVSELKEIAAGFSKDFEFIVMKGAV